MTASARAILLASVILGISLIVSAYLVSRGEWRSLGEGSFYHSRTGVFCGSGEGRVACLRFARMKPGIYDGRADLLGR